MITNDSSEADTQPRRTMILNPVTLEAHEVEGSLLMHDFQNPVSISWDAFQEMGNQGCLTPEKFLASLRQTNSPMSASRVLVVQLKGQDDACQEAPMYAWASRMKTTIPDTEAFPENIRNQTVGSEFIWMWTQSRSYNAWLTRCDRRRTNANVQSIGIDEQMPTVRYASANPGIRLGPDDLKGCRPVPFSELTASQRFFIASIKPQQTNFQRRVVSDRWTNNLQEIVNTAQFAFNDKIVMHGRKAAAVASMLASSTDWTVRHRASSMAPKRDTSSSSNSSEDSRSDGLRSATTTTITGRKRTLDDFRIVPAALCENNIYQQFIQGSETSKEANCSLALSTNNLNPECTVWKSVKRKGMRQFERGKENVETAKRRRWAELPHELLIRILSISVRDALSELMIDDTETILTSLSLTSKGVNAFLKSFVGIQLSQMTNDVRLMLTATDPTLVNIDPTTVGRRARAFGLQPEAFMSLQAMGITKHLPGWTLPRTPVRVPTIRQYKALRRAKEQQYTPVRVHKPKGDGTKIYQDVVENLLNSNPSMYANYLGNELQANEAYEEEIKTAGDCDTSEFMLQSAGV